MVSRFTLKSLLTAYPPSNSTRPSIFPTRGQVADHRKGREQDPRVTWNSTLLVMPSNPVNRDSKQPLMSFSQPSKQPQPEAPTS